MLPVVRIALVVLAMCGANTVSGADDAWDYPSGRQGVNDVSAGRAGQIRVYECETPDSVETVILWYANRLRLADDHSLFVAASKGFSQIEKDQLFHHGFGHDTDDRKDHTQMVAHLNAGHAHVSFFHRPDFRLPSLVTISIAETPSGTSVPVIQPLPVSDENAFKGPNNTK